MFKALKPCSFAGQKFKIGETIPAELVHPTAVTRLIRCGVIAEAGNAGPLLPAVASIEEGPANAEELPPQSEDHGQDDSNDQGQNDEDDATEFTEAELMELTKAQLVEMASQLGKEVTENDTKKTLTAYILEVQAGSDE